VDSSSGPPALVSTPFPEIHLRQLDPQQLLPLAAEGVYRVVWESRFGEILIEVVDGTVSVNGVTVDPISRDGADSNFRSKP
jgi:hypothetical protein